MAVTDYVSEAASLTQRRLDRAISPETRQRAWEDGRAFAQARPLLFSFILSQLLFSFFPVLLFVSFVFSIAALAFGAAALFTLFWIGVALLVLVPTLFLTFGLGFLAWIWGVASFIVARWCYNMIPASVKGEIEVQSSTDSGKQLKLGTDEHGGIELEEPTKE